MEKIPLISVIMPAYNVENYIRLSIESILNQTFTDFELIIIDDCSSDKTVDIIESFDDSRIKLIRNESNMRLSYNLNLGISIAQGKYIARMDSDDISMPERFQTQVDFMEKNTNISIVGTNYVRMDNNDIILHPLDHEAIKIKLFLETAFAHPTVMMRREDIINRNLLYKKEYIPSDDYKFWTEAAIKGLKLANLSDVHLKYRIHQSQMSSDSINQLKGVKQTRKEYALYFSNGKLSDDELLIIENRFEGYSTQEIVKLLDKLRTINKENKFFNQKLFSNYLWYITGMKIDKTVLCQIIKSDYSLNFKYWIIKSYTSKILSNTF